MNKALKSNRPKNWNAQKKKKNCMRECSRCVFKFKKKLKRARNNCKSNQLGSVFLKKFKI